MRAVKVPHNPNDPIAIVEVGHGWQTMAAAIGGGCQYIERVRCPLTPKFGLVMVVDEDGQMNQNQPNNLRAWPLYPTSTYILAGDVLVMAEGMTDDGPDFIDLPDPELALELVERLLA